MYTSRWNYKKRMAYGLILLMLSLIIGITAGCGKKTDLEGTQPIEAQKQAEVIETEESTLLTKEDASQLEEVKSDIQEKVKDEGVIEASQQDAEEKVEQENNTKTQVAEEALEHGGQEENKPEAQLNQGLVQEDKAKPIEEERVSRVHDIVEEALVITGVGLKEDIILKASEWTLKNADFVEVIYSSNNNFNFHKIWKVKGYDLNQLLEKGKLRSKEDYLITFESSDGVIYQEKLSSLNNRYRYPDFTVEGEEIVQTMIGFFREELFDSLDLQTPVKWEDKSLGQQSMDHRSPRLYLGQKKGDPSDKNQPLFIRELVRIIVGE